MPRLSWLTPRAHEPVRLSHFPISLSYFAISSDIFWFWSVILLHSQTFCYSELNHSSIVNSVILATMLSYFVILSTVFLQWTHSFLLQCSDHPFLLQCSDHPFFYSSQSFCNLVNQFAIMNSACLLRFSIILVNLVILLQWIQPFATVLNHFMILPAIFATVDSVILAIVNSSVLLQCSIILWFCQSFSRSCQICCYSARSLYSFVGHFRDSVSHFVKLLSHIRVSINHL
jgi:hypothetical protein